MLVAEQETVSRSGSDKVQGRRSYGPGQPKIGSIRAADDQKAWRYKSHMRSELRRFLFFLFIGIVTNY